MEAHVNLEMAYFLFVINLVFCYLYCPLIMAAVTFTYHLHAGTRLFCIMCQNWLLLSLLDFVPLLEVDASKTDLDTRASRSVSSLGLLTHCSYALSIFTTRNHILAPCRLFVWTKNISTINIALWLCMSANHNQVLMVPLDISSYCSKRQIFPPQCLFLKPVVPLH